MYRQANYTYNGVNVGCNQIGQGSGTYNNHDNLNGWSGDMRNQPIFHDVEDVPVGTQICFATAIYPASSFGEHNVAQQDNNRAMQLNTSNPRWRYGKPSCAIIAKRPRVQFLGAGVNVPNGRIDTSHGTKNNTLYGSWSEFEAVASGSIVGLASGGAFGNYGLENANTHGRQSWSRQTVTNANQNNLGNYNRGVSLSSQRLRGMLTPTCDNNSHPINHCGNRRNLSGGGHIGAGDIATWVVDGNASITGNITYHNGTYSDIASLPQALIYIKGDLNIHPDVTRIDAWIIVEGTLNTCHGGGITGSGTTNLNHNVCDKKLVFNGSVTAKQTHLRRTGGAGVNNARRIGCNHANELNSCDSTGPSLYPNFVWRDRGDAITGNGIYNNVNLRDTSGDPAEVFNLRGDNFKWSLQQNRTNPQIRTMYTREIAPRF
jgi:hypothetical protein